MKILLFGGNGQLGLEVQKRALDLEFEVISPVQSELDILDRQQVIYLSTKVRPDLVINCAAYTAVDQAENDAQAAFAVNADGAATVAIAAHESNAKLIHISTDYVFDGTATKPIKEADHTKPLNVYGQSKLAGEQQTLKILPNKSLIVRTSSLHGAQGQNFVHTMIKLMTEKPEIKVVRDQIMSPTWAGWLAEIILDLGRLDCCGVVHASCAGAISWFDFATAIKAKVGKKNAAVQSCALQPTTSAEFFRPAKRPTYSVFDCQKLTSLIGRPPISWQEGLNHHLSEVGY